MDNQSTNPSTAEVEYLHEQLALLRKKRDKVYQLLDSLPVIVYQYDLITHTSLYCNREVPSHPESLPVPLSSPGGKG